MGVVLGRMTLARPLIDAGHLVALFDEKLKAEYAHYLVYPPRSQHHRGLAVFREWLLEEAHAYQAEAAQVPTGKPARRTTPAKGKASTRRKPSQDKHSQVQRAQATVTAVRGGCRQLRLGWRPRLRARCLPPSPGDRRMKRLLLVALVPVMLAACVSAPSNEEASTAAAAQPSSAAVARPASGLEASIQGAWRDPKNVARDQYRHPRETLSFFGIAPTDTVIEITPGGGWYAEILAPYVRDHGHYIAAVWDDAIAGQPKYRYDLNKTLRAKFAGNAAVYGTPEVRVFNPKVPAFGQPGSANAVVTFRNAHNWVDEGNAEAYFKAFYDVLTPGGTLGVVDHRAKPGTDLEKMKESGYLTEELVIASPRAPASCWRPRARSTPTRRTRPIIPTACGRCRR